MPLLGLCGIAPLLSKGDIPHGEMSGILIKERFMFGGMEWSEQPTCIV